MTDVEERVLTTLRMGSATVNDLAEATDIPEDDLEGALMTLVRDGQVCMVQAYWPGHDRPTPAGWSYSLTAKGTAALDGR